MKLKVHQFSIITLLLSFASMPSVSANRRDTQVQQQAKPKRVSAVFYPAGSRKALKTDSQPVGAQTPAPRMSPLSNNDPLQELPLQALDIDKIIKDFGRTVSNCNPEQAKNPKLKWDPAFGEIGAKDYALTAVAGGTTAAMFFLVPPPKSAKWKGGILFDDAVSKNMTLKSKSGRQAANDASDYLLYGLVGYAMADGPAVALANGDKKLAAKMAMVNAETILANEAVMLLVSQLATRKRPADSTCASPENGKVMDQHDPECVRSFYSGHEANAFAAAGIICSTHDTFELYGGFKDKAACVSSLGAAMAVGALRIASGNHYATDVLTGAAIGYAIGYLLPNILHYHFGERSGDKDKSSWGTLLPVVKQDYDEITSRAGIQAGIQYQLSW
jgi:membrane-associated phospholipid phosphatase